MSPTGLVVSFKVPYKLQEIRLTIFDNLNTVFKSAMTQDHNLCLIPFLNLDHGSGQVCAQLTVVRVEATDIILIWLDAAVG